MKFSYDVSSQKLTGFTSCFSYVNAVFQSICHIFLHRFMQKSFTCKFQNSAPDLTLFKFAHYFNFVKTPAIYSKELHVIKPPEATLTG